MSLSSDQIAALFKFTEKKSVHWYDLQLELVDHLASSIEAEMEQDAKLTFDAALEKVYARFGIFGFAMLVREKGEQLQKAAGKLWWAEVRQLFGWPQVVGVMALLAVTWQLTQWVPRVALLAVFAIGYIGAYVHLLRSQKKWKPRLPLLLVSASSYYPFAAYFIMDLMLYSQFWNYSDSKNSTFCLMVAFGAILRLASYRVQKKMYSQALANYPAAFT